MDKLQYVMDLMHRDFGCSTNSADYATESILLFRNELDRNLLPDFFDEINPKRKFLYITTPSTNILCTSLLTQLTENGSYWVYSKTINLFFKKRFFRGGEALWIAICCS
jgi:hypothetical protein